MATNHDRPTRRCSEQTRAERRHGMTSGTRPGGKKDHCGRSRETPSRARPDERCSSPFAIQTFEAQAPTTRCSQRRKSGHKHGMAEFTTSLKTTPSTRAARGGEGSEWCWLQPDHTQPRAAREEACGREHVGQHVDGRTARRKATLESHGVPWRAAHGVP